MSFSPAAKIVVFIGLAAALIFWGQDYSTRLDRKIPEEIARQSVQARQLQNQALANLKTEDLTVGKGTEAKSGDKVSVNYIGKFADGKEFDNSYKRGKPLEFTLGAGQVIPGWDYGIRGMKVGGKRNITIPPELAYGSRGSDGGVIPPNSTLYFTVELVAVNGTK